MQLRNVVMSPAQALLAPVSRAVRLLIQWLLRAPVYLLAVLEPWNTCGCNPITEVVRTRQFQIAILLLTIQVQLRRPRGTEDVLEERDARLIQENRIGCK